MTKSFLEYIFILLEEEEGSILFIPRTFEENWVESEMKSIGAFLMTQDMLVERYVPSNYDIIFKNNRSVRSKGWLFLNMGKGK